MRVGLHKSDHGLLYDLLLPGTGHIIQYRKETGTKLIFESIQSLYWPILSCITPYLGIAIYIKVYPGSIPIHIQTYQSLSRLIKIKFKKMVRELFQYCVHSVPNRTGTVPIWYPVCRPCIWPFPNPSDGSHMHQNTHFYTHYLYFFLIQAIETLSHLFSYSKKGWKDIIMMQLLFKKIHHW